MCAAKKRATSRHWNTLGFQLCVNPELRSSKKSGIASYGISNTSSSMFQNPAGRVYLEIELTEANDAIDLPPFIEVERDVTEEAGHSNYDLAKTF